MAVPVSFLLHAIALCSDTEKICLLGEEFLCFESSLYVELKLPFSGYQGVCYYGRSLMLRYSLCFFLEMQSTSISLILLVLTD